MHNSFPVQPQTLLEYKRYSDQVLLDMSEIMSDSKNPLVKETLLSLHRNEYYYHLEYYQKIIINFLFFRDYHYLNTYLRWRKGLYSGRGIDEKFLIFENEELLRTTLYYIKKPLSQDMTKLHGYVTAFYNEMFLEESDEEQQPIEPEVKKLYTNSLEGESEAFREALRKNAPTLEAFCDFFTSKISKVLTHIGTEWQKSLITVAQEHRSTALIRDAVYAHLETFPSQESRAEKFFISSVAGEQHSFGLELTSKILHLLGYEVATLGSKFSKEEVVSALYEFGPHHLLFVLTLPTSLIHVAELIAQIHTEDLPTRPKSYVAGGALGTLSNPYASLECDYYFADFTDFYRKFSP